MAATEAATQPRTDAKSGSLGKSAEAYVAFAFAAADLLMEVGTDGRVIFAIGASMALVGRPARLLANSSLPDLFVAADRPRVDKVLRRMGGGARVRHALLSVQFPGGERVPVALSGYPHPDHEGRLLCVLTHGGGLAMPSVERREGELLDKRSFESLANNMMRESGGAPDEDDGYRLTLLDFPELAELRQRAGAVKTAEFIARFTEYLRQCSVGGDSAGELGQAKYGLLHGPEVTPAQIEDTVQTLIASVVGGNIARPIEARTMDLDTGGLSGREAARALAYTINAFANDEDTGILQLADAARPKLSSTVGQMREVKSVIDTGDFDLHVQPIVDLWNNAVHHFEFLVRFRGEETSPFSTVTFAESVGLSGELDCAILRRAIDFMRGDVGGDEALKFAVNISGRSLGSASTAARLLTLLQEARDLRGRLLFEVTESAEIADLVAANAVIQEVRALGHPVGLDDFGAGSAAFHYLRALKVDHVKIDGSYVRDLQSSGDNVPFLKAIAQLCRELRVATIAEHIENEGTANLLKVYNVRYGQGYHFGKPSLPRFHKAGAKASWVSPTIRWRNGLLYFGPEVSGGGEPA